MDPIFFKQFSNGIIFSTIAWCSFVNFAKYFVRSTENTYKTNFYKHLWETASMYITTKTNKNLQFQYLFLFEIPCRLT